MPRLLLALSVLASASSWARADDEPEQDPFTFADFT